MRIIVKVWENKMTHQKYVTIPAKAKIVPGDYVEVKKI
jgi:hypothetical protein